MQMNLRVETHESFRFVVAFTPEGIGIKRTRIINVYSFQIYWTLFNKKPYIEKNTAWIECLHECLIQKSTKFDSYANGKIFEASVKRWNIIY